MMYIWLLILLFYSLHTVDSQRVDLDGLGTLEGDEEVARDGSTFLAFRGVPYATPPLGSFRFRPAAQVAPWEGVRQAKDQPGPCTQQDYFAPTQLVGSEDCLYLNVYTKKIDPDVRKPVIVYIHGGAFIFGGMDHSPPQYIMEEDVVFVSIQYRLGPFGFLSTEDKHAPGNYGLQDQLTALRWMNEHIASFGGDPSQVTLVGISAGGASVHYLLLSPNTDGLFHRAVALSGSALCWWASLPNPKATAVKLGANLGCSDLSSEEMLECIRGKSTQEIMEGQSDLYSWRKDKVEREPMNIWSPRVDKEAGESAVISIDPHQAAQVGQIQPVPFLVGVDESEGIWRAMNYIFQDDTMLEFVKEFENVAPYALGLMGQVPEGEMKNLVGQIKKYYLSALWTEEKPETRLMRVVTGMIQMLGDSMFNYPIDRMVKIHGNKDFSPVWMYQFNYIHNHSVAYLDIANGGNSRLIPDKSLVQMLRPTHAQEAAMLFPRYNKVHGELSEEETNMSRKYIKFILEFARKGVPTMDGKYEYSDWKPIADSQLTHHVFGKYSATQIGLPYQHRMKWWNDLPVFWKKDQFNKKTKSIPKENTEGIVDEAENNVEEIVAEPSEEDAVVEEVNQHLKESFHEEL